MAKKMCVICGVRPQTTKVSGPEECEPCYDRAGHANTHEDSGHDELIKILNSIGSFGAVELREIAKGRVRNTGKDRMKSGPLRDAITNYIYDETHACWICHPELDETLIEPKAKRRNAPTIERPSRKGQKINVPLRAPGADKAAVVVAAAGEEHSFLTSLGGGVCSLDVNLPGFSIHLSWDAEGRYDYDESYIRVGVGKTKKVRNVAEALRWIKNS